MNDLPQGEGGEGGTDRPPRRRNFRSRVYRRRQGDEEQQPQQNGDAPVSYSKIVCTVSYLWQISLA